MLATWMDFEMIILSEESQKEKGKTVWFTYKYNLKKNDTKNLSKKQK